jgi:hypothetical protein
MSRRMENIEERYASEGEFEMLLDICGPVNVDIEKIDVELLVKKLVSMNKAIQSKISYRSN